MATIYTFREVMHSPYKDDCDLILAEWVFEDGKYKSYQRFCDRDLVEALDLSISWDTYLALTSGIFEELMDTYDKGATLTEDIFQRYIKFFINDFYFRKER